MKSHEMKGHEKNHENAEPVWSHPLVVASIPEEGEDLTLVADEETRAAADDAKRKIDAAAETQRSFNRLVSPKPEANPGAQSPRPGYTAEQNRALDGLAKTTQ